MKAEFIDPFLQAAVHVLSTMARLTPKAGKAGLKEDEISRGDVTGLIGFTGPAEGSMSLTFSEACALSAATFMTGERFDGMGEEVADAVGELTNMVAGDARRRLEGLGYKFQASIPTVVQGKGHTVTHIVRGYPIIYIPFTTENGSFCVEACFAPTREKPAREHKGIKSFGMS